MSTIAIKFDNKFRSRQFLVREDNKRKIKINEQLCPFCEDKLIDGSSPYVEKKCKNCVYSRFKKRNIN